MRQDSDPKRKAKKMLLYNATYQGVAKTIRATASHCYLCLSPFTPHNPVQVDHLYPSRYDQSPLLPACGRCNRKKGNTDLDKIDGVEFPGKDAAVRLYPPAGTL
jgi:5-methylcytosine-specific restriction endonuclease McrA